jgi:hypothetical protein
MRHRPKEVDTSLGVGVIDAFLEWAKNNCTAQRTNEWYQRHLQVFAKAIPSHLAVGQLKKFHLTACLTRLDDWSAATKNGLCRAFQWAEDEDLILKNPLRKVKKPAAVRREILIPSEEMDMLDCFPSEGINDLLTVAWETRHDRRRSPPWKPGTSIWTTAAGSFPSTRARGRNSPVT